MAKTEAPKPKHRPIIRIGILIISHSFLVSVICCTAGVVALLLLPVLAKNTYISENALMPGSASRMLSNQDIIQADSFFKEITGLNPRRSLTGIEIPRLIAQHMSNLGGEVSYHKFQPQSKKFHPLNFFTYPDPEVSEVNFTCSSYGVNTVGIIRAPRGDGKEALVLVTPYNSVKISQGEALSLAIAYSVFSLLTRVNWLAKDIIWLAADSQHGEYAPVASWLRDYHTPSFGALGKLTSNMCHGVDDMHESKVSFRRGGTMAAALVIKVADISEEGDKDTLSIYAEASNGQMPNLDLFNIVNYLAVHGQGLRVKVDKFLSLFESKLLKSLGGIIESVGKIARSLNPEWNFGISEAEYIEGTATLASSLYNQALGIPTGPHGAFRDYQVDAVTLEISPKRSSTHRSRQNEFLFRGGRLIEGVLRSVNNLLEKFHQSFFLYMLTSPSKFVSVGVYMIAFLLLVAPLPVVAASLFSDANKPKPNSEKDQNTLDEPAITFRSWRWLYAAKTVFIVHLWGTIVTLLPYFIYQIPFKYQIPNSSPTNCLLIWLLLSASSLLVLHLILGSPEINKKEWALLKSVTVSTAFIGLCLMSVINFATAEIGAVMMVPMCLLVTPLKLDVQVGTFRALSRAASNLVLVTFGFPGVAFFLLKGGFEGFDNSSIGEFWYWLESLWAWNSATYIYICTVHLPCWVLCTYILLHSC